MKCGRTRERFEPVAHETADRIATGTITALPFIALGIVCWQVWGDLLRWSDVVVFADHVRADRPRRDRRLPPPPHASQLQDRSRPLRGLLAILGSVAIEGPMISWVADHRKHHTYSDQEGDPHSPHVGHERRLPRAR